LAQPRRRMCRDWLGADHDFDEVNQCIWPGLFPHPVARVVLGHSHALWQLYGNRGVAVRSTIGKVKDALLKAGVRRGKVAPLAYVNLDEPDADNVFSNVVA